MYWPTMPDNILDIVIAATAGTTDTWWSKFFFNYLNNNYCYFESHQQLYLLFVSECPNGHDYFVQNVCLFKSYILYINIIFTDQCGRPVVGEVKKCFCGAPIGGKGYNVVQEDNIKVADKYEYFLFQIMCNRCYILLYSTDH